MTKYVSHYSANLRKPVDSIREAVFTVSPNKQYRGILFPTTPATHGPVENSCKKQQFYIYHKYETTFSWYL